MWMDRSNNNTAASWDNRCDLLSGIQQYKINYSNQQNRSKRVMSTAVKRGRCVSTEEFASALPPATYATRPWRASSCVYGRIAYFADKGVVAAVCTRGGPQLGQRLGAGGRLANHHLSGRRRADASAAVADGKNKQVPRGTADGGAGVPRSRLDVWTTSATLPARDATRGARSPRRSPRRSPFSAGASRTEPRERRRHMGRLVERRATPDDERRKSALPHSSRISWPVDALAALAALPQPQRHASFSPSAHRGSAVRGPLGLLPVYSSPSL